jgi:hypothetical protein
MINNKMSQFTYTAGFSFKTSIPITRKDYINLCLKISEKLNEYYGQAEENKILILPEAITEGGIYFSGKNYGEAGCGKWYKSLRHVCHNLRWPYINNNVVDDWSASNEILFPANTTADTCLKSFKGAPIWKLDELKIIKSCFEEFGIKCTSMPRQKNLISQDKYMH